MIRLVHDLLDNQLRDRDWDHTGKVDGIVLEIRDGQPPRIAALEVGTITVLRRISRRLASTVESVMAARGPKTAATLRIPWNRVRGIEGDVVVNLDADEEVISAWEHWLRDHIVHRLPGGRGEGYKGKPKDPQEEEQSQKQYERPPKKSTGPNTGGKRKEQ